MPAVGKPMNVPDLAADQQRRIRPDPGDGTQELRLGIGQDLLSNHLIRPSNFGGHVLQLSQIAIEGQPITGTDGHGRQKSPTLHPERRTSDSAFPGAA